MDSENQNIEKSDEKTLSVEKPYKCPYCVASFNIKQNRTVHERTHTGEKPYKCELCGKKFANTDTLKRHRLIHTGEKPFKCQYCEKTFSQVSTLQWHETIHTNSEKFECSVCEKKFSLRYQCKRHERRHSKSLKCRFCDKKFSTERDQTNHEKNHTGEKPFECHICGKKFMTKSSLNGHKKTHTNERPFKCKYCEKAFVGKHNLITHEKIHTSEGQYQCNLCEKRFIFQCRLLNHEKSHATEKLFQCQFCDKKFKCELSQKTHEQIHILEKSFECDICGKKFLKNNALTRHKIVHTGEKPFKCLHCSKKFSYKQNLRLHELAIHRGKRFECKFCGKLYPFKSKLVIHERTHTEKKPFECNLCKKRFISSTSLAHHKLSHKNKQYKCQYCKKTFKNIINLKKHQKSTHADEKSFKNQRIDKMLAEKTEPKNGKQVDLEMCKAQSYDEINQNKLSLAIHENIPTLMGDKKSFTHSEKSSAQNDKSPTQNVKSESKQELATQNETSITQKNSENNSSELKTGISEAVTQNQPESTSKKHFNLSKRDVEAKKKQNSTTTKQNSDLEREKEFQCEFCEEKFDCLEDQKLHLEIHLKNDPDKLFKCRFCQKEFETEKLLNLHEVEVHNKKQLNKPLYFAQNDYIDSSECNNRISDDINQNRLESPSKKHLNLSKRDREVMEKQNSTTPEQSSHHEKEKEFQCEFCREKFNCLEDQKLHLEIHLKNVSDKQFKCQFCEKKFGIKRYRNEHELRVHKRKQLSRSLYFKQNDSTDSSELKKGISDVVNQNKSESHPKKHLNLSKRDREVKEKQNSTTPEQSSHHEKEKEFQCEFCKEKFNCLEDQKLHLEIHLKNVPDKPFKCQFCETRFGIKRYRTQHELRVHKRKQLSRPLYFEQNDATDSFKLKKDMFDDVNQNLLESATQSHMKLTKRDRVVKEKQNSTTPKQSSHHEKEKEFQCEFCREKFNCLEDQKLHLEIHLKNFPDKPFKCQFCEKKFGIKRYRNEHELRVHKRKQLSKPLYFDQNDSTDSSVLKQGISGDINNQNQQEIASQKHIKVPTHDREVKENRKSTATEQSSHLEKLRATKNECKYCGKHFSSKGNLKKHEHLHKGVKKFQCRFCEKKFSRSDKVNQHERTHTGEKPFKCDSCDRAFTDSSSLVKHKKSHTGEKPHKCSYCDKCFIRLSHKVTHERVHTGERPFKCNFCEKTYITDTHRKQHQKTHTGLPFKCRFCEKRFSEQQYCRNHERSHTGEKPFQCRFCEKKFGSKQHRNRHEVEVHKKKQLSRPLYFKQNNSTNSSESKKRISDDINENQSERTSKNQIEQPKHDREVEEKQNTTAAEKTSHHEREKEFQCEFCIESFSCLEDQKLHLVIHFKNAPAKLFKCRFCEKTDRNKGNLTKHERIHTGEKPFQCRFCEKKFGNGQHLNRHEINVHNKSQLSGPLTLQQNDSTDSSELKKSISDDINQNQNENASQKQIELPKHDREVKEKPNPIAAEKNSHPERENEFLCEFCSEKFNCLKDQKIHLKIHLKNVPDKLFKCRFCEKNFGTERYRKQHEVGIHNKNQLSRPLYLEQNDSTESSKLKKGSSDDVNPNQLENTSKKSVNLSYHDREVKENLNSTTTEQSSHPERENKFQCEFCVEKFDCLEDQKLHLEIHFKNVPVKLFKCRFCKKTDRIKGNITKHERLHTGDKPYKCRMCEKLFSNQTLRMRHEQRIHEKVEVRYKCGYCEKTFIDKNDLTSHEANHTGNKPFNCENCNKQFATERALKKHQINHFKAYGCQFCEKKFAFLQDLITHENQHTGNLPFKCDYCEKRFPCKSYKMAHEKSHSKPFECVTCQKRFSHKSFLKLHEVEIHFKNIPAKLFKCKFCEKTGHRKANMTRHERSHAGKKLFKCRKCEMTFTTQYRTKIHERRVHEQVQVRYKCKYCEKIYKDKNDLASHESNHTGNKPFKCESCDKQFGTKYALRKHKITHFKPYKCHFCEKKFAFLQGRKIHENRHTRHFSFKCDYCEKCFPSKSDKIKHHNFHTKPFECKTCPERFSTKSCLRIHELLHLGIKYECQYCQRKFVKKLYLNRHIETHHSEKSFDSNFFNNRSCSKLSSIKLKKEVKPLKSYYGKIFYESAHPGKKLFKCQYCPKIFITKSYVRFHVAIHHRLKCYECKFCNKKFLQKQGFIDHKNQHVGKMHSDNKQSIIKTEVNCKKPFTHSDCEEDSVLTADQEVYENTPKKNEKIMSEITPENIESVFIIEQTVYENTPKPNLKIMSKTTTTTPENIDTGDSEEDLIGPISDDNISPTVNLYKYVDLVLTDGENTGRDDYTMIYTAT